MRKIELSGKNGKDKFTVVDNESYDFLSQFKWYSNKKGYAVRNRLPKNGKNKEIFLHRLILAPKKNMFVDHINGDRLDNRLSNLRICSQSENSQNQKVKETKAKGVFFRKDRNRWFAIIRVAGKAIYLGYFNNPDQAAEEYDKAAKKHFGKFARTNYN